MLRGASVEVGGGGCELSSEWANLRGGIIKLGAVMLSREVRLKGER